MKQIPLCNRQGIIVAHTLVDDDDYEWLSQWKWHLQGGKTLTVRRKVRQDDGRVVNIKMHRQIMDFPDSQVDHEDGNRLNNQRFNLRIATHAQNQHNRHGPQRNGSSGYRGVTLLKLTGRWKAQVQLKGKNHHLGYFDTPEEANVAASTFRKEHMTFSTMDRAGGTQTCRVTSNAQSYKQSLWLN